MKTLKTLSTLPALLLPSLSWAHGGHLELPSQSVLHLLAHHWPFLLAALLLSGVWVIASHRR